MEKKDRAASAMSGGHKAPEKKSSGSKKKGRKVHRMTVRHASNGGYVAQHDYKAEQGEEMPEPEEHVIADMPQLQEHMAEHMAQEPEQEPQAPAAA